MFILHVRCVCEVVVVVEGGDRDGDGGMGGGRPYHTTTV